MASRKEMKMDLKEMISALSKKPASDAIKMARVILKMNAKHWESEIARLSKAGQTSGPEYIEAFENFNAATIALTNVSKEIRLIGGAILHV